MTLLAATLLAFVLALAWLGMRFDALKRTYYAGVMVWSRWLPVCATGLYLGVLTVNLASGGAHSGHGLSLKGIYSPTEVIVMFLVGPLFLTNLGSALATAVALYCMERLLLTNSNLSPSLALYLVVSSVTVVAVLGDKMPWHADGSLLTRKIREILLVTITIGALAILFAGLVKAQGFGRWLEQTISISLPAPLVMLLLVSMFLGWLSVALGYTRHFTIPILSIPTLCVVAYLTSWPSQALALLFALCLALSLATADRRLQSRRRGGGFTTVVLPY